MHPAVVRLAVLGALIAGPAFAPPAAAKDGVRAVLERPVDMSAAAGRTLIVRWRLLDRSGNLFSGQGIYLRVSRCGRAPRRVEARERSHGHFIARVRAPRRGLRRLAAGLPGWRMYPSGRTERADAIFPFDPPLEGRRCR